MKYPPRPLSRFAGTPSAISAHNSHVQIRKPAVLSAIDFQDLSFHQLTNPFSSKPFVFSSMQNARVSNPTSPSKETNNDCAIR
jgi:hypothetical protein